MKGLSIFQDKRTHLYQVLTASFRVEEWVEVRGLLWSIEWPQKAEEPKFINSIRMQKAMENHCIKDP